MTRGWFDDQGLPISEVLKNKSEENGEQKTYRKMQESSLQVVLTQYAANCMRGFNA